MTAETGMTDKTGMTGHTAAGKFRKQKLIIKTIINL